MVGGLAHVNARKMNLPKKRRQAKQQSRAIHKTSARDLVEKANAKIPDLIEACVEATAKKRELLLLSDKPHENTVTKVKYVTGIRAARMGKHGVQVPAVRINKKKVKKLIRRTISQNALLEAINSNEVEMQE
jgi:hypothetical protein